MGGKRMIVRRAVIVGLIVATGTVATNGAAGASAGPGAPTSIVLVSAKSARPLTKAQFISKANALCADAVAAFAAHSAQFAAIKKNPTTQEISAFVSVISSVVQNQINKTRALKPPKVDQALVTQLLQADQTELNKVKADPQLLGASTSPFLTASNLARKLGLQGAPGSGECSKAGSAGGGSSG
jgi:hypothetical protein